MKKMVACTLIASALSLGAGCDDSRERPTGLNFPVPETEVIVRAPQPNAILFTDSLVVIEIGAVGSIQAVEFVALSVNPIIDTIAAARREYEPPLPGVDEQFTVQMPSLLSGTTVEIRGLAENLIGQRITSATVTVTVVDCDVEPFRCG